MDIILDNLTPEKPTDEQVIAQAVVTMPYFRSAVSFALHVDGRSTRHFY